MSDRPPTDRVFIDTSEPFPYSVMDLRLTLAGERVFEWYWIDELLDEWERVQLRRPGLEHTVTTLAKRCGFSG
jgi:hypothetical protein